jgi:peptidoglycan/LPS O-acetylase OafA/YrhL
MAAARPPFRTDIEGLRGVAILLVVLFHAGVSGLAGGFVGVDVFFVLSGFFITGLLVEELTESGEVDLAAFWGRRARRLIPPLLLVLLATLAMVMWLYAPIDRAPIASTARAVALYGGNIEFARNAVDYFSSGENPLLHTWSLAVEEQFYLVWPLLFLIVGLFLNRRQVDRRAGEERKATKAMLVAVAVAGIISFIASIWLTSAAQPWAFFGMPTRVWEFALGGVLALVMTRRNASSSDVAGTLLQVAGLFMIGFGVVVYSKATAYPGLAALLPALGAIALLVGGEKDSEGFVSRALSISPLRWLGRVSYAWYLWHWPLVGLGAVLDPSIGVGGRLVWSGLALVLAWLTYRFVEGSARHGRLSRIPANRLAPAALGASLVAALIAHGAMIAAERRVAHGPQRAIATAREDRVEHGCWATTVEQPKEPCAFGDTRSSTTIALLGDSHAEHWLGALDRIGRERGWKIVAMVKGGCPVADMPELTSARRKRYYEECARYREAMVRRIIAMKPTAAILASWDHYMPVDGKKSAWQVTPATWQRGLRKTYTRLTNAGIRTIAIRDVPHTPFDVPACLSRRAAGLPFAVACAYERAGSLSPVAIAAQTAAVRGLPVRLIDMNDQICSTARCPVVRNGIIVFTDDNHLTASFSRSLAPTLGARLAAAIHE